MTQHVFLNAFHSSLFFPLSPQHFLLQWKCKQLIRQGVLEHVLSWPLAGWLLRLPPGVRLHPTKVTSPPPSLPPQGPLLFGSKMETFFKQECLAEEYGLFVFFFLFIWMLISLFFISEYNSITFHGKHICEFVLSDCTLKYRFSKESLHSGHTENPHTPTLLSTALEQSPRSGF